MSLDQDPAGPVGEIVTEASRYYDPSNVIVVGFFTAMGLIALYHGELLAAVGAAFFAVWGLSLMYREEARWRDRGGDGQ